MKLIITDGDPGTKAAEIVKEKLLAAGDKKFVLSLPTGGTPLGMYKNLARMNADGEITFKNVITFNLDEYEGLGIESDQSYRYFMENNFFKFIDIKKENINIPNGLASDLNAECEEYERKIKAAGGIDLLVAGVGENGHLAFNEPGSPFDSKTRVVELTEDTINVNARYFANAADVPRRALSMGVGTILGAREILVLASGAKKAEAVRAAFEAPVNPECVITALRNHPNAVIIADKEAASLIK